MNQNEIRVGNWLNDPRPLTEFNKKYLKNPNNGYFKAKARDIQFAEEFEPIPLTKEILLNCGFVYIQYFNNWGVKEFGYKLGTLIIRESLEKTKYLYDYNTDFYIVLKSLHQLQNLYFALTGQELEINL